MKRTLLLTLPLVAASVCLAAPAVEGTHVETESIGLADDLKFGSLRCFCMDGKGNILACDGKAKAIRVVSPAGKLVATWEPGFAPDRIALAPDGTVYAGGAGVVAKLDADGKILKIVRSDGKNFPKQRTGGIGVTDKYVFAAFGQGGGTGSTSEIHRFDRDWGNGVRIATGIRGCCQRIDIAARDGVLYVAENARYRVLRMDAEGKALGHWGQKSRTDPAGFGACCNPMGITFGPGDVLYTASSGTGRVKRYTPEGKFLGMVGEVGTVRFSGHNKSCSYMPIGVSRDGGTVWVQDFQKNIIRVLKAK